jgi:hypothetical protein
MRCDGFFAAIGEGCGKRLGQVASVMKLAMIRELWMVCFVWVGRTRFVQPDEALQEERKKKGGGQRRWGQM